MASHGSPKGFSNYLLKIVYLSQHSSFALYLLPKISKTLYYGVLLPYIIQYTGQYCLKYLPNRASCFEYPVSGLLTVNLGHLCYIVVNM